MFPLPYDRTPSTISLLQFKVLEGLGGLDRIIVRLDAGKALVTTVSHYDLLTKEGVVASSSVSPSRLNARLPYLRLHKNPPNLTTGSDLYGKREEVGCEDPLPEGR